MRVLTDTQALVWALSDPQSLSAEARQTLTTSEVLASVANLWEHEKTGIDMNIKTNLDSLPSTPAAPIPGFVCGQASFAEV